MTTDTVVGGSHTVALAFGKSGVHASVDGATARSLPVKGKLNAESLAAALDIFTSPDVTTTVLLIGTRADGTPGWDQIDPDELTKSMPHEVFFLSEAQALALEPGDKKPAAWVILATTGSGDAIRGSARWWVQNADSAVTRVDVQYLGQNYGQIFTLAGENLANSPILVAGLVEALLMRHDVARVYVWSQDGLTDHWAYTTGVPTDDRQTFWEALRLDKAFVSGGNDVVILPRAVTMLETASRVGVSAATATAPTTEDPAPDDESAEPEEE